MHLQENKYTEKTGVKKTCTKLQDYSLGTHI